MKRFIIIDTELQTQTGHNFNATSRSVGAALSAGFKSVIVGCNRSFAVDPARALGVDKNAVSVLGAFTSYAYDLFREDAYRPAPTREHLTSKPYDPRSFFLELKAFLAKVGATSEDVIYMHTFSAAMAEGLLSYLRSANRESIPAFHIIVYMPPDRLQLADQVQSRFAGILERMKKEGYLYDRVFFFSETKRIRKSYLDIGFDLPVLMGPIPSVSTLPKTEDGVPDVACKLGYLGEARFEKGFWLVPKILQVLFSQWPALAARSEFYIQAKANPGNAENPQVKEGLEELRALAARHNNVHMLESLSKDGYEELLAKLDVVLLPYDLDAYDVRGSGVAYEALSRGQVLVVPDGIDIAETYPFPNVVKVPHYEPESFAEAISVTLDPDERGKLDRSQALDFLRPFFQEEFANTVLDIRPSHPREAEQPCESVLLLCCASLYGGISMVQKSQLHALDRLGYDVYCLFLPWPGSTIQSSRDEEILYNGIDTRRREYGFDHDRGLFAYVPFSRSEESVLAEQNFFNGRYQQHSVEAYGERMGFIEASHVMHLLNGRRFSHAIVNYPFYVPALEALGVEVDNVVLETHDLQAKQMHFRRVDKPTATKVARAVEPHYIECDYRAEMDLASGAGTLVHISAQLAKNFNAALPNKRHVVARPCVTKRFLREAEAKHAAVSRMRNLAQVLSSGYQIEEKYVRLCSDLYWPEHPENIDLLFVGSQHAANIASLQYFIDAIYLPFLSPRGVTLYVVGNICNAFEHMADKVRLVGKVESIIPLVMAAKINILSVTDGTGFPTKIIETLSLGQAFSASAFGFYELKAKAAGAFPLLTTPEEWVADILALLLVRPLRARRGAAGRDFAQRYFGEAQYLDTWAKILGGTPFRGEGAKLGMAHTELRHLAKPLFDGALLERLTEADWAILSPRTPWLRRLIDASTRGSTVIEKGVDSIIDRIVSESIVNVDLEIV